VKSFIKGLVGLDTRPMPAVRSVGYHWRDWIRKQPLWAASLFYAGRLCAFVSVIIGAPVLAGARLGLASAAATFGLVFFLSLWGYVHRLLRSDWSLRP
jgi:hypothetical protein